MSDPVEDWFYKYFSIMATGAVSGIGAAMGWFRVHRISIMKHIAALDERTNKHIESVEEKARREFATIRDENEHCYQTRLTHGQEIAVLQAEQRNTSASIQDIKTSTRDTNMKLDDLIMELRKRP